LRGRRVTDLVSVAGVDSGGSYVLDRQLTPFVPSRGVSV